MGLDIYVGTLTRYYTREWETVVQRMGREQGMEVQIIRANEQPNLSLLGRLLIRLKLRSQPEPEMTKDEVREHVLLWQKTVIEQVNQKDRALTEWSEDDQKPYFTDKPDWSGYGALIAWACHAEKPDLEVPSQTPDVFTDPPYVEAMETPGSSQFPTLFSAAEFYLPAKKSLGIRAPGPNSDPVGIATTKGLLEDLIQLNEMTWDVPLEISEQWLRNEPNAELSDFESDARFGWAAFYRLASDAVKHGLPMKLDY